MKYFLLAISLCLSILSQAQYGPQPPFTIELEAVQTQQALPGMHSGAFAQSGSRWLFVGGRTNGLHGFSTNNSFDVQYANGNIVVIDTATWTSYASPVYVLGHSMADPLQSTNMQSIQEGNYLYMFGGFGWDSTANHYTTYPTVTALRVDSLIDAVITGNSIAPHIRQITDTNMRVCGGELAKLNNDFYLFFGHDFRGRYSDPPIPTFTQVYSNKIKKFDIQDNGTTFQITNYSAFTDTNVFHRRDLNVGPIVKPDGSLALEAYSGVFQKEVNWPWPHPVMLDATGPHEDTSFYQKMNNYTCGMLPVFDSLRGDMYTVFFGGTSWWYYNSSNNNLVFDSLVPFVHDITVAKHDAAGQWVQSVLPVQMPGLLGSNMKFIAAPGVPEYSNEVVRLRDVPGRVLAGYLYGGIRSTAPNLPPSSAAHDTVYRVYITPDMNLLHADNNSPVEFLRLFPNPAGDKLCLRMKLSAETPVSIKLCDVQGKLVRTETINALNGQQDNWIETASLSNGLYFLRIETNGYVHVLKFSVLHG